MWSVKTRSADVLIGQSLVVSVLASLCYRCSMTLCIVSVMFTYALMQLSCYCSNLCFSPHWVIFEPTFSVFCWSVSQLQLFCLFCFWHHDQNNLTLKIWVERKKPKVNMLKSELCAPWARWWSPGRAETLRRSGVRESLNSSLQRGGRMQSWVASWGQARL